MSVLTQFASSLVTEDRGQLVSAVRRALNERELAAFQEFENAYTDWLTIQEGINPTVVALLPPALRVAMSALHDTGMSAQEVWRRIFSEDAPPALLH